MVTEFGMSPALGPVRLAGDQQAVYLGPQFGLDSRVSQETAGQVDSETRRLVEEALDSASALLSAHRGTLDRLAERLCDQETVNGSEVTAMLAEAAAPKDAETGRIPIGGTTPAQRMPAMGRRRVLAMAMSPSRPCLSSDSDRGREAYRAPDTAR